MSKFSYSNALVTGASSGIGEALARELQRRGANVILVARRADRLAQVADELNALRPGSARTIVADISTEEIENVLSLADRESIDLLVNNAGIGSFGFFEKLPLDRELLMLKLNIDATVKLAHRFTRAMKQRGHGALISISSIAGFQPVPYMASYSATKAFNFTHSMALRQELLPFGVRVLTVCPGPIATEFGGVARVPGTPAAVSRDSAETVARESLDALEKNRAWIVTGPRGRLISLASRFLPKTFCTWITKKILDPVILQARL